MKSNGGFPCRSVCASLGACAQGLPSRFASPTVLVWKRWWRPMWSGNGSAGRQRRALAAPAGILLHRRHPPETVCSGSDTLDPDLGSMAIYIPMIILTATNLLCRFCVAHRGQSVPPSGSYGCSRANSISHFPECNYAATQDPHLCYSNRSHPLLTETLSHCSTTAIQGDTTTLRHCHSTESFRTKGAHHGAGHDPASRYALPRRRALAHFGRTPGNGRPLITGAAYRAKTTSLPRDMIASDRTMCW